MIKPYFLRCKQSDFAELVALGKLLGVIREVTEEIVTEWDEFFDFYDTQVELLAPILDENDVAYIHINILTRFDLRERATELATQHPELAIALGQLGKFFILDEAGEPRKPKNPQCSF